MILPGFGADAQKRLLAARALIVGCGALGCAAADLLARAGVGHLIIVDRDVVEHTNLQRQCLFDESDARDRVPKAAAAERRLHAINSSIRASGIVADVHARNIEAIIHGTGEEVGMTACDWPKIDVVIDATDNFQTRYLLNDVCVKHNLPLIYGGVVGTQGMTMTILPASTVCLRCVFPDAPDAGTVPTCDTVGVLGPMVQVVASIQAAETLKILTGHLELVRPTLSSFDIWNNVRRTIDLVSLRDQITNACPCCGKREFAFLDGEHGSDGLTTLCGTASVQVLPTGRIARVDLARLASVLQSQGPVQHTSHMVRVALEGGRELTVFRDGRAIVGGVKDGAAARAIYARYVGT